MKEKQTSHEISARASFYRFLPLKEQVNLFAAVFFTFAPVALLFGARFYPHRSWHEVLAFTLFSGLIAVGWAFSFIRNIKFLLFVIPSHITISVLLGMAFGRPTTSVEGLGSVLLIALGYGLFIKFIDGEGAKSFRLQTEMALAQQIHSDLVPPINRTTSQLELLGKSVPSSAMGGDLLDVFEENGKVGLYIADVSGHGVQAGVVMGMVKSAIRMQLLSSGRLDSLFNNLNQVVLQVKKPELFVTFASMWFDGSPSVEYSLAGHLPILHYHRESGTLRKLSNKHLPLGVLSEETYRSETVGFSPGDLFVLLTDGLTEVLDDDGREFGEDQIKALIIENADKPLSELYRTMMRTLGRFGKQMDDQTLLLARVL